MKKIFTVRNVKQQQRHMWDDRKIDDEVSSCSQRNIKEYFLKYLPRDDLILEAGCGAGAWLIYLKDRGYNIEGTDHDKQVISQLKVSRPELAVRAEDICRLPHADNSLGAYISLGVIEHFEEGVEQPLTEAMRVIKPGGVLILTVPFNNLFRRLIANHLRFLYLLIHQLRGGKKFFAEYRYSFDEVLVAVDKAGFDVVESDIDDFNAKDRSLTLWSEFPMLQDKTRPYSLNILGRAAAYVMNSISRSILASGILVIAKKPVA